MNEIAKLAVYRSFHTFRGLDSRLTSGSKTMTFLREVGLLKQPSNYNGTPAYSCQPNYHWHKVIFCLNCKSIQSCNPGVALPFITSCGGCRSNESVNFWTWDCTTWKTFEQWPPEDQVSCMDLLIKLSEHTCKSTPD